MDFWLIFITGLTVGGLTCVTVQGGLLMSAVATRVGKKHTKKFNLTHLLPIIAFLTSKLFAYSVFGFLLGWLGETLAFNDTIIISLQLFAGLYMIGIALHFLKVHPIFHYLIPQLPKSFSGYFFKKSESKSLFAPIVLGFMTILIPCGSTLAMEALAISTGNPWQGSLVMAIFVIGTIPLFFALGIATSSANLFLKGHFHKFAALLIIILGLTTINGPLVVLDSPITAQKIYYSFPKNLRLFDNPDEVEKIKGDLISGVQIFDIKVTSNGYEPRYIKVQKDRPVMLVLISEDVYNCALAFRIPQLKIAINLIPNSRNYVEFTPTKAGKMYFSCAMGMYIGIIEVE